MKLVSTNFAEHEAVLYKERPVSGCSNHEVPGSRASPNIRAFLVVLRPTVSALQCLIYHSPYHQNLLIK
jgi:hypothetical protein